MSNAWQKNLAFNHDFFQAWGKRNRVETHFIPNASLAIYQKLLSAHTSQPDLLEVDVVWSGSLADDLIDLRPFVQDRINGLPPQLLASYLVHGRLIALPETVDMGVLYYRSDLLARYGFKHPPETWTELASMAARIQAGERQRGDRGFWGYIWQGALSESATCNALEWQASEGAGNFIEADGRVHVRSPLFVKALDRALGWMSVISPPSEYVYWEDDSMNLWSEGKTAFMRNWASGYGLVSEVAAERHQPFGVAPMPAGPGGHRGTLGGSGVGVSKYAANRDLALQALLELTDEQHDLERTRMTGDIPAHTALTQRADVKAQTPLLAVSSKLLDGLVARPSGILGKKYDEASHEYATAINQVLRRKRTPEAGLAELEKALTKLTGFPPEGNQK